MWLAYILAWKSRGGKDVYLDCDWRIISSGLTRALEGVAGGRDVILKAKDNVENALTTTITAWSIHDVALDISLSTRQAMPVSVTTSCLVQNNLTLSAVARAVGQSKCYVRTRFNNSRHVFAFNHSTSKGASSMLLPSLRESSSTRIVRRRVPSIQWYLLLSTAGNDKHRNSKPSLPISKVSCA